MTSENPTESGNSIPLMSSTNDIKSLNIESGERVDKADESANGEPKTHNSQGNLFQNQKNISAAARETLIPDPESQLENNSKPQMETEDPVLPKMKQASFAVVTLDCAGILAYLQASTGCTSHRVEHILKILYAIIIVLFGGSAWLSTLVALTLCITNPKSPTRIRYLKYALRVAIFLGMLSFSLVVVFLLMRA